MSTLRNVKFSQRERQVLDLRADGFTNAGLAKRLGVHRKTTWSYGLRALNKTDAENMPELINRWKELRNANTAR